MVMTMVMAVKQNSTMYTNSKDSVPTVRHASSPRAGGDPVILTTYIYFFGFKPSLEEVARNWLSPKHVIIQAKDHTTV